MFRKAPVVLLVEHNAQLRELNRLILEYAGYRIVEPPEGADPVGVAARTRPDVIVFHLGQAPPYTTDLVDRLREDPTARRIPVCTIAVTDERAAEAQAAPNVPTTILAPYDLEALEGAVADALNSPPAAAILPEAAGATPAGFRRVADALNEQARQIVLEVVFGRLRQQEPYKSRFRESSGNLVQIVDHLGEVMGAIIAGLRRDLTPEEALRVPHMEDYVDRHVRWRREQGFGVLTAVGEYQLLGDQIVDSLQGLVGPAGLDAAAAVEVARRVQALIDTLVRMVVEKYHPEAPP